MTRRNQGNTEIEKAGRKKAGAKLWLSIAGLLFILFAGGAVAVWGGPLLDILKDQERIGSWLEEFGPWGPLVSIGLNAAQVLLAPIPGQVLGLANGFLFGFFWGTLYSMAGLLLGSTLAMTLGRWLGRPAVVHLIGADKLKRLDGLAARRGPLFFFLIFLLPLVPDDIACFAIGLSPLSIPIMVLLAAIGRLPGLIVSSWIGSHAGSMSPLAWTVLIAASLALGALVLRYRKQMEAGALKLANRLSGESRKFDPKKLSKLNNPDRLNDIPPHYLLDKLELKNSETLIDIGAGTGFFSIPIADHLSRGKVFACDISPEMIKWMNKNVRPDHPNIIPVQMKEYSIPLEDGAADGVLMINLHHELEEPERILQEAFRLLKRKGKILIVDWKKEDMPNGPPVRIRITPEEVVGQLKLTGFSGMKSDRSLAKHFLVLAWK